MKRLLPALLAPVFLAHAGEVSVKPQDGVLRPWLGAEVWANPAEDWLLKSGRFENSFAGGNRNFTVLTAELTAERKPFSVSCLVDQVSPDNPLPGFVGFELGVRDGSGDYRGAAVQGAGMFAGVRADGTLFINRAEAADNKVPMPFSSLRLELKGEPEGDGFYKVTLAANDATGMPQATVSDRVHESWLTGLVACVVSSKLPPEMDTAAPRPGKVPRLGQERGGSLRAAFSNVAILGGKVAAHPERAFGPVYWTTQTVSNDGSVVLLVQAAPFADTEKLEVSLSLDGGKVKTATRLDPASRTARFTLRSQDVTKRHTYEVTLAGGSYKGTVLPVPTGRPVVVAALSCDDAEGFPHSALVKNVVSQKPDMIAFLGDQIYEGVGGYGHLVDQAPNDRTQVCYLRKFALHGWIWRDLLRDIPSVTLPDDHDVFQGNLWGADGVKANVSSGYGADAQDSGGYMMSPDFVNVVHATQTGNLPAPADAMACGSGISLYFTDWEYGPLDMAILADRQFKSPPAKLLPDGRIRNGSPFNPAYYYNPPPDASGAELLGYRQDRFLRRWAQRRDAASPIRLVLSQTPWIAALTLPLAKQGNLGLAPDEITKAGAYPPDDCPKPDFDTNGWPQGKRADAVREIKRAGALHVTGDQHLGTTGQYGLDGFRDGPWWVSTPATANIWPRRWMPSAPGGNPRPGDPRWTGDFTDAFGNRLTMAAVANPTRTDRKPARIHDLATGYTILTCNPAAGTVTIANWPYLSAPDNAAPDNKPFPGWPITIRPATGDRL